MGIKKSISSTLAITEEEAVFEDANTKLIQLVHKHNNLYDKSAKDYKDNLKRKESWAEIVAQFNSNTDCDITGILHLYTEKNGL